MVFFYAEIWKHDLMKNFLSGKEKVEMSGLSGSPSQPSVLSKTLLFALSFASRRSRSGTTDKGGSSEVTRQEVYTSE